MKHSPWTLLACLLPIALVPAAALAARQGPPVPEPARQHVWLEQLVGEWDVTAEVTAAPGAEPMRMESTASVHAVGELWIVAEGSAEIGGAPYESRLTLGYDPDEGAFVGTWIDSMLPHLWIYEGALDGGGDRLVLLTRGPSFADPAQDARFRETFEVLGPDRLEFTSSMEGADGEWFQFAKAEYRRRAQGTGAGEGAEVEGAQQEPGRED